MTDSFTSQTDPLIPRRGSDRSRDAARDGSRDITGDVSRNVPFDDFDDDITDELDTSFWGTNSDWVPVSGDEAQSPSRGRRRSSLAAGRTRNGPTPPRRRTHRGADSSSDLVRPVAATEAVDVADDAEWPGEWSTEDTRRTAIDPLIARLGGLAVALTIMVPVVLGFTADGGDDLGSEGGIDAVVAAEPVTTPTPDATAEASPVTPTAAPSATAATTSSEASPTNQVDADPTPSPTSAPVPDTTVSVESRSAASCAKTYEIVAGDFWIRIADGSGVAISDLLAVNDATQATALYPGRSICLPAGAATPPPPTTVAAPTASSGGSTATNTPSTTVKAPTPTTPTTTQAPLPPASSASVAEVQAIIRAVWPDELEERALEIAHRESKFIPSAKNWCCTGLFQIYWSVHQSWLADMGITSANQLTDPTLNARAALKLYERAGGWGPWGG